MKSEIVMNSTQTKKRTYPWLGYSLVENKQYKKVVLFTSFGAGVVVSAIGDRAVLGEYCEAWCEDMFEEFKGKVILSND